MKALSSKEKRTQFWDLVVPIGGVILVLFLVWALKAPAPAWWLEWRKAECLEAKGEFFVRRQGKDGPVYTTYCKAPHPPATWQKDS